MSDSYSAGVDFRISKTPPDLTKENAASIEELYNFSRQVIRTFIDNCGIAQQLQAQWPLLVGSPRLLQSGNLNRLIVTASEAISPYAAISLTTVAGALQVRNANATNNTRICDGFCTTAAGAGAGGLCEVTLHSGIALFAGLTPGYRYWLSTTNGIIATGPAVAAGNVEQYLGVAIDTVHLAFNLHYWVQH
jgi:hypothetical protein